MVCKYQHNRVRVLVSFLSVANASLVTDNAFGRGQSNAVSFKGLGLLCAATVYKHRASMELQSCVRAALEPHVETGKKQLLSA